MELLLACVPADAPLRAPAAAPLAIAGAGVRGARGDQRWSLTDCASFLVMEERNITAALAYDRDFEQPGFTALLREGREAGHAAA